MTTLRDERGAINVEWLIVVAVLVLIVVAVLVLILLAVLGVFHR